MRSSIKSLLPSRLLEVSRPARYGMRRAILRIRKDSTLLPIQKFFRDGYNDLLTKALPLTEQGIAVDFGGYRGDWTASLVREYGCHVHVFEPVADFVDDLAKRFGDDSRVTIYPYAIGLEAGNRNFQLSQDGTGCFATGSTVPVRFESARCLAKLLPETVDVVSINIEGGEYELIPALHAENILGRVGQFFVQFHRLEGISDVELKRNLCREMLSETHQLQWSYDFVWELWTRRPLETPEL